MFSHVLYIYSDFFTQNLGPYLGVFTILKMGKYSQKVKKIHNCSNLLIDFYE